MSCQNRQSQLREIGKPVTQLVKYGKAPRPFVDVSKRDWVFTEVLDRDQGPIKRSPRKGASSLVALQLCWSIVSGSQIVSLLFLVRMRGCDYRDMRGRMEVDFRPIQRCG